MLALDQIPMSLMAASSCEVVMKRVIVFASSLGWILHTPNMGHRPRWRNSKVEGGLGHLRS